MERWAQIYLVISVSLISGCNQTEEVQLYPPKIHGVSFTPEELTEIRTLSPVPPNPPEPRNNVADSAAAALLGRALFFETRLSANNAVSCATCHQPELDWTDGLARSKGLDTVTRNAPTLFNLAHQRWYFWDGRKDSLWSQSLGPIENAKEMGGSRWQAFELVRTDPNYRHRFEAVFGTFPSLSQNAADATWDKLSPEDQHTVTRVFSQLGKAIAAFERQLISTDSPFDRLVAGLSNPNADLESLYSPEATRGLKLFVGKGDCTFCHSGPNFTDLEFHNLGLDRGTGDLDVGRFAAIDTLKQDPFNGLGEFSDSQAAEANRSLQFVAQKPNNLGEFKTPTLRNVANTAPYMHDGRFASLREVLEFYSELDQEPALGHREETLQPLALSESEINALEAFLQTLTGAPLDEALLRAPDLSQP